MSSEVHKHIEESLKNNNNLYNAELINFPSNKKIKTSEDLKANYNKSWKLYDKTNINEDDDQLKAVIGICLMFSSLLIMGLYSSLS
tara:strand:+ start:332 stop:589 length:258 start_codon:yes stop_codon:yes gene_type:complete